MAALVVASMMLAYGERAGSARAATPAPTPSVAASGAAPAVDAATPTASPCRVPDAPSSVDGRPAEPYYPLEARARGIVGTTRVTVTLTSAGTVAGVAVTSSSGDTGLDQSSLRAAALTTYLPRCSGGTPVGGSYIFSANFSRS